MLPRFSAHHGVVHFALVRHMSRAILWSLLALPLGLVPDAARADVIDPNAEACGSKNEGDACKVDGEDGSCVPSTCFRNDYSDGTPPKSVSYDCLMCKQGAPEATPEKAAPEEAAPEKAAPGEAAPEKAAPLPEPGPPATQPKTSGCSVAQAATSSLSIGVGLLLLGFVRRRRR